MWQRIVEWWKRKETREYLLIIITGLAVANVRHSLEHHGKSFDTWGDFFVSWFVHTFAILLLGAIALAAILYSHKFFLGQSMPDIQGIFFYIVMTVLVGALCIWVIGMNDYYSGRSILPKASNFAKLPDLLRKN
jgi:hypothetical protein